MVASCYRSNFDHAAAITAAPMFAIALYNSNGDTYYYVAAITATGWNLAQLLSQQPHEVFQALLPQH